MSKPDFFSTGTDAKRCVQRLPRNGSILFGTPNQEIISGAKHGGGENKAEEVALIVAEPPTFEVNALITEIENLHPIFIISIFISNGAGVGSHYFIDADWIIRSESLARNHMTRKHGKRQYERKPDN